MLVSDFLKDEKTFYKKAERLAQLRGLRVQLTYEPAHTGTDLISQAATIDARMKTIAGTGLPVTEQKFELKGHNGNPTVEVTVKAYFEKSKVRPIIYATSLTITAYNARLQSPDMPAINCGTDNRPKWYPAEKLLILPYQMFKRTVPDTLTADMLDVACHFPETTRALIEHEGLRKLGLDPEGGPMQFVSLKISVLTLHQ